jgi:hypothetical protein
MKSSWAISRIRCLHEIDVSRAILVVVVVVVVIVIIIIIIIIIITIREGSDIRSLMLTELGGHSEDLGIDEMIIEWIREIEGGKA